MDPSDILEEDRQLFPPTVPEAEAGVVESEAAEEPAVAREPSAEDEPEDVPDELESFGSSRSRDVMDWSMPAMEDFIMDRKKKVPFADIKFDETATKGQARPLDYELAVVRQHEIRKNVPAAPIEPILWQESAGGKYIPLTLQHTTKACMLEQARLVGQVDLPPYLQYVRGTILKPDTPLHIRELIAGADQNRQESIHSVRLSRVAQLILRKEEGEARRPLEDRLRLAIMKTGHKRPETRVCIPATL
jgi:hypothetical protein